MDQDCCEEVNSFSLAKERLSKLSNRVHLSIKVKGMNTYSCYFVLFEIIIFINYSNYNYYCTVYRFIFFLFTVPS